MRPPAHPFSDWTWRWLDPPEQDVEDRDGNVRNAIVAITMSLSSGGIKVKPGRSQLDVDKFDAITERRYVGNKKYSDCCDLVGGALALAGCTDERIINRDDDDFDGVKDAKQPSHEDRSWWDDKGAKPWKVGANVSMLYQGSIAAGAWVKAEKSKVPSRGDSFLLDYGTNEHFGTFVTDMLFDGHVWSGHTVEGGQVDEFGQCVKIYRVEMYWRNNVCYLRRDGMKERVLHGWIDATKLSYTRPALLPPMAKNIGVEPAE